MPRNGSFWRNVAIIGLAHVAVLTGVLRWSASAKKPVATDILWMEGGVGEVAPLVSQVSLPAPTLPDVAEPPFVAEAEASPPFGQTGTDDPPIVPTAKSDLELPTPSPPPSATPRPSASSPRASPKATPKPSPRPTPKKTLVAKVSPKPAVTPSEKKSTETKKVSVKAAPSGKGAEAAAQEVSSPGGASQFSWYGSMLHDRFFGEWAQPTSIAMSGARMSALVRIRIEKDGSISNFSIVRSSGNVVVDESVAAIARRVTQVNPPPSALSNGGHYDVQINFELNPE